MDISIGDEEYFLDYYIVMDWMGLVAELGLVNPANARDEDIGCGFCGIQMGTLRHEWWRILFKVYQHCTCVTDFLHAVFSNASMKRHRYCMMYLININLIF